ncbi:MAG: right-handed parallel beta-helix repeat-containing protein [Phycisphaerae bacterium]
MIQSFTSSAALRAVLVACALGWFASPVVAQTEVWTSLRIQQELDTRGVCQLPAGNHNINVPIRLRAGNRLVGTGYNTRLNYTGGGPIAIVFGEVGAHNFACYLDNISLLGGGVKVAAYAQHCAIERVWINGSSGDGLRIDGVGERLKVSHVICWDNAGHGFAVRSTGSNNGVFFDHCSAQENGGFGLYLETAAQNASLNGCVVRDCTFQSNGDGGQVYAEVLIRGFVGATRFENVWIENTAPHMRVGIRTEGISYAQPTGGPIVRRPGRVVFVGNNTISLMPRAIEFVDCFECVIDQLQAAPATAQVRWRSAPGGGDAIGCTRPRGDMLLLPATQLIADPLLR